ncbi:MAG: hypothetical protein GX945_04135 [Lentisphaerae bacterium]|nr:hypothetical protein [Lentisphaerota bacterium]
MKKILLLGLMGACCLGFAQDAAAPADAPPPPPAARQGGPGRGPGRGQGPGGAPAFIERLQTSAKEILALYDLNGDGKLDEAEKAAMEKEFADIEKKARLARFYPQIKAIDTDGDMVISPEEAAEAPVKLREHQQKRIQERQNRPDRPGEGDRRPPRRQGPPRGPRGAGQRGDNGQPPPPPPAPPAQE